MTSIATTATAAHFVYIQRLAQPIGDTSKPTGYAKFYAGEAADVEARTDEHMRGVGAKLLAYAVAQGVAFEVELVIACDSKATAKTLEALIKSRGGIERQLPSLRRLAQQVVTMELLASRGRKDPKAVVEARQVRLNKRAEAKRQAASALDAEFESLFGNTEIVRGGARPIDTVGPVYTSGVAAHLFAEYDLSF